MPINVFCEVTVAAVCVAELRLLLYIRNALNTGAIHYPAYLENILCCLCKAPIFKQDLSFQQFRLEHKYLSLGEICTVQKGAAS